jgi:hypothetical protein
MLDTRRILLGIFGAIAVLLYLAGVIYAGALSYDNPKAEVPQVVDYYVTSASTTLATFLGMLLGFRVAAPVIGEKADVPRTELPAPIRQTIDLDWFQVIIAIVYFLSLLIALGFWGYHNFLADAMPLLRNLTMSLLGIIGGALAVLLNVR